MSMRGRRRSALDYQLCHYGVARLAFRGPKRNLGGPYALCLGGSETFGKFVARPFADLLEGELGYPVANWGVPHGGIDTILAEPSLLEVANRAQVVVVQITGAFALSNRYFAVHPRRNDRFLRPTEKLRALYPTVDFTEIAFAGHLIRVLRETSPTAYETVAQELRRTWLRRMACLLDQIEAPTVLLWAGRTAPPEDPATALALGDTGPAPLIDAKMIETTARHAERYVQVVAEAPGTDGMIFDEAERAAAGALLCPASHRDVAAHVMTALRDILPPQAPPAALRA